MVHTGVSALTVGFPFDTGEKCNGPQVPTKGEDMPRNKFRDPSERTIEVNAWKVERYLLTLPGS